MACALAPLGCSSAGSALAGYQPGNVYRANARLPIEVRRVAVLPITASHADRISEAGRDALQPVLYSEIHKRRAFELVFVTREQLRSWSGRPGWDAEETLPHDFFERIRAAADCDAVLFCQLTQFQPYGTLAIGWSLKLVDANKPQIWWAVDEVFDAGQPSVISAARRYSKESMQSTGPLADCHGILASPRRFGQYTASAVLATMPAR